MLLPRRVHLGRAGRNGLGELLKLCNSWRRATTRTVYMYTDTLPCRDLNIGVMHNEHFAGGHLVLRAAEPVEDRFVPAGSTEAHISWERDEGFTLHWFDGDKELFHPSVARYVNVTIAVDNGTDAIDYVINTRPASTHRCAEKTVWVQDQCSPGGGQALPQTPSQERFARK